MDLNNIAGSAIDGVTGALDGKKAEAEKTSFGSATLRFFISLIWGVVTFVILLAAFYAMWFHAAFDLFDVSSSLGIMAVVACFAITLITFLIPYLRKKGSFTRSCGVLCLGEGLWWLYILATL